MKKKRPVRMLRVNGHRVELVTKENGEDAEMVVCVPWSMPLIVPDNQTGACFMCKSAIQFRPDVPQKPPRVCLDCAMDVIGSTKH